MKTYGTNTQNALASDAAGIAVFIQLDFASGTQRYWTGAYDISWNSQTWTGAGGLCEVGEIRETEQLVSTTVPLRLHGTSSALVSLLLSERVRGRSCTLWFAALDASENVMDTPPVEFAGKLDEPAVRLDAEEGYVQVNVVSKAADWAKPKERRYNDQDQQNEYPGDTIFDGIHNTAEMQIVWPARSWFKKFG